MDISGITARSAAGGKEKAKEKPEEGCRICGDDHQHIRCPYLECVPPGATVGPDYLVICDLCRYELLQPTATHCWMCGKWGGRAVEASTFDESYRNHLEEDYIAEPIVYAEYIDFDNYTAPEPEQVQKTEHQDRIKKHHTKIKSRTQREHKNKSQTLKKKK